MANEQYIYQDRAVVFLDVLGFQEKLNEFQNEAIHNKEVNNTEFYVSAAVDEFINTFKSVVNFLNENDYRYYLFSDNICITIDFSQNRNRLIDILITINDLFFKFAQKGYFIRGGLDVGKFVDEKDIAIGIPLANAYKIEQSIAMFPRIVLSDAYKKLLDSLETDNLISDDLIIKKNFLVKQHCEVFYINTFFNLFDNENKIELLKSIRQSISMNIIINNKNEKNTIKYEWLAREFNFFLEEYITQLIFLETNFVTSEEEVETIKSLKFTEYAK
jgi:hypothetical protein